MSAGLLRRDCAAAGGRIAAVLLAAALAAPAAWAAPPEPEFARLKPWAVLLLLAQPRSDAAGMTLDRALLAQARRRKIAVLGLEMSEEQVAALDTIPLSSQVALVYWALARQREIAADHEAAIAAWLARDLARLDRLSRAPGRTDPALAPHLAALSRQLVEGRSILMAHRLFLPLRVGHLFVAVGALHLHRAVALQRAQGYRITRVY